MQFLVSIVFEYIQNSKNQNLNYEMRKLGVSLLDVNRLLQVLIYFTKFKLFQDTSYDNSYNMIIKLTFSK